MNYKQFTAQELYCMSRICGEVNMFGLPDGFETLDEESARKEMIAVEENLINKQIIKIDIDGRQSLSHYYREIVYAICRCDRCLTISYQYGTRSEDIIFWKTGEQILRAEVIGDSYVFIMESCSEATTYLNALHLKNNCERSTAEAIVIPNIALAKAKRAALDGAKEESQRLLLQNGADHLTELLYAALSEKADYLSMVLFDGYADNEHDRKKTWLGYGNQLLSLSSEVNGFRSCTRFSVCSSQQVSKDISEMVDAFLPFEQEV